MKHYHNFDNMTQITHRNFDIGKSSRIISIDGCPEEKVNYGNRRNSNNISSAFYSQSRQALS